VLEEAVNCLSAYQILDRLPAEIRSQVIAERGMPGSGAGKAFTAASLVSMAAAQVVPSLEPPHRIYVDCRGLTFSVAGSPVVAGHEAIAFYRLRTQEEMPGAPTEEGV